MTSLEPSPPKRLKIPPSRDPPRHKSASPSKLPVRNGSTILVDRTKGSFHHSPSRTVAKKPQLLPYTDRQSLKMNGDGAMVGKLNFSAGGSLRDGGGNGRFRRAGGPRLSQSPARRSSFFTDVGAGSSVSRMDRLGEENKSRMGEKSSPTEKLGKVRKPEKMEEPAAREKKRRRPKTPELEIQEPVQERVNTEDEALRKLIEARVNALRMEVEDLREEVQKEEARIEKDTIDMPRPEDDLEAMIKRLLSANDSSHTSLPALKPLAEDPTIPSAKPLPSDTAQLSAFHCLTFTSTSTSTLPSDTPDSPLTHRHSTSGYASTHLLFFTLTFTVSYPSSTVTSVTHKISPWARRELNVPLSSASNEGNINTVLYTLSSYTTLAKKRATVFARLCRTFPSLLPGFAPKKDAADGIPSRREIVPWLGVGTLKFRRKGDDEAGVELVMSWGIEIDEGGEAESVLAADVRLPVYWTEVDEMNSFAKVGEMFDVLVKERGVFEATKCIVGLVFQ